MIAATQPNINFGELLNNSRLQIVNTLLLNTSFIDNLGLMNGKMGISIFFFHLARQTKNKIYKDYAEELIDEIYEEISLNTPVDFENGLAGIGWGIEYLVQNKFIEADTDEVLEEFDNRIYNELIYNTPQKLNLLNSFLGHGFYFLTRIKGRTYEEKNLSFLTHQKTLIYLIEELDKRIQNITKIIREPKRYRNFQTLEPSNYKPQTTNKKIFDLTWDFPALLWFLSELYEENISSNRVKEITQRLINPLTIETNLPKLQSNRLLLALALINIQQTINHEYGITNDSQTVVQQSSNRKTDELSTLQTIINKLLYGINRNTLKSELPSNNDTIRYGISGIKWMYKQLYKLTGESNFKNEFEYWINQNSLMEDSTAEEIRNMDSWGLLEGYSGYLLIDRIELKNN